MPQTPHLEHHFKAPEIVRDIVIGMSDGLTVPFALAAGLSGAIDTTHIIVTAGLAEIAAGAIAMGLGGYLSAKSDADHYAGERAREEWEVLHLPEVEAREVAEILEHHGLTPQESAAVVAGLSRRSDAWVDWMMRFELGLEKPNPKRAPRSAATIGGSYVAGGLIPLAPYIVIGEAHSALIVSIIVTLAALAIFGFVKGRFTAVSPPRSAIQTALIGGFAAAAAFAIARLITQ